MVDDQPKWRTGKICYIETPASAGNILGIYQQPGLAEAKERNQHG